jgi:hypothetical protein
MASECCNLVGNFDLNLSGCIVSVSTNSFTEFIGCGDVPVEGPSMTTINFSGYASLSMWKGCPGRAGVSIPYVRKYDCENDKVYLIFNGLGQSYCSGDADKFSKITNVASKKAISVNANASSGPTGIYEKTTTQTGYGLSYSGSPVSFVTSKGGTFISLNDELSGYLQNFTFEVRPGEIPVASYSLIKVNE